LKRALALLIACIPAQTRAEYRAYQYMVNPGRGADQVSAARPQPVVSTLNPVAFRAFHPATQATLLRTWMCVGYTGKGKSPCPAPGDRP
jgi:hypothetical protein